VKVLFVLNSIGFSGTEASTAALLPLLRQHGIAPLVVCLHETGSRNEEELRSAAIPLRVLTARSFIRRVLDLRRLIRADQPDVIVTALFTADQLGRLAAIGTGVPVVSSLVSTPYGEARRTSPELRRWKVRLVQELDGFTARHLTAALMAVSEGVARENSVALRYPRDRITVIPRGRDASRFVSDAARSDDIRRELGLLEADRPVILNIGRHEYAKGHTLLLEGFLRVLTKYPHAVLIIAGREGSETRAICHAIDSHQELARSVKVLGHRDDIGDLLAVADVLAVSSRWEGTAGAVLEAFAGRVPVVVTRLAGLEGVVDPDETAVVVPPEDPQALAAGILRVLDDPDLAGHLAARGRHVFDQRFTIDSAAHHTSTFLRTLIGD
jgi:glycosyltransferase involved in cell wall biosynthesis